MFALGLLSTYCEELLPDKATVGFNGPGFVGSGCPLASSA